MTAASHSTNELTRRDHLANIQLFMDVTQTMTERAASDGISEQTVRSRIREGKIPAVTVGHQVRVWRDDVDA